MLGKYQVSTSIPVVDLARAKKFYVDKLGLKVKEEDPSPGALLEAGKGSEVYIYQRAPTKADHTVAAFKVDNVVKVMKEMRDKGIVFEEYNLPGIKTVNGVATMGKMKMAWFKDGEGNILAVGER